MKASIIGTTGYGGVELLRILHQHPEFDIHSIHSTSSEDPIWKEYPHLFPVMNGKLQPIDLDEISAKADVVFLATPSGASSILAEKLMEKDIKIIDLSGDLRLEPDSYEKWYKKRAGDPSIIKQAVYGLSEWNENEIQTARLIANPGCYPTATLLGLGPIVKEGLVDMGSIIVDAKSGVSGAGRGFARTSSYAEANENLRVYKMNEHQHIPEIEKQLQIWNEDTRPISFTTHLLPITRGIMATCYAQLQSELETKNILELYHDTYSGKPFVHILPENHFPAVKEVAASNYCNIGLHADQRTGRITIISVIDNLMKGAAGQAVQNANIMFGMNEDTGLNFVPIYP
ncbi:N-acetyl-gamma-glutamyl-phosphate reductase [Bacillus mesophilum]|uniref:N-acetyl-gamma-glutamyl-phosphate reductase n=1 Tax=Bacillus mesophilum TaxID=1071718 RepID=A0A7V7UTW2_9BACI|nr:N-acetyl-gamma-glutamyl-phosphate reductase [Bacillus mesophilum]KAB2330887.1 N-acetyl-gamma-glutamyl-phosphate reductase [Bacillus mesophilum]